MFFGSIGGEFCPFSGCGSASEAREAISEMVMAMTDFILLKTSEWFRVLFKRIRPFDCSSVEPAPAAKALSLQRDLQDRYYSCSIL